MEGSVGANLHKLRAIPIEVERLILEARISIFLGPCLRCCYNDEPKLEHAFPTCMLMPHPQEESVTSQHETHHCGVGLEITRNAYYRRLKACHHPKPKKWTCRRKSIVDEFYMFMFVSIRWEPIAILRNKASKNDTQAEPQPTAHTRIVTDGCR